MGLFKSKKTPEMPPVGDTHIHQPSAANEIFARFMAGLIVLPVVWLVGTFILAKAGISKPDVAFAQILLWGGGALLVIFLLSAWTNNALDRFYAHREAMEKERTLQLQYRRRMAVSAVADTRRLGSEARLTELILLVMQEAYDYHARYGLYQGTARPWSRRGVRRQRPSDGERPTETEAAAVKQFLTDHGIVTGTPNNEQLNLSRYPDFASVQRLLHLPVLTTRPPAPVPDARNHISVINGRVGAAAAPPPRHELA